MEKINVGIIGCGRISDLHFPGYENNKAARLYAVCDTDPELGELKKRNWGAAEFYQDYQELLADPVVDAVEILAPQLLHEKMVIDAIGSGKHVALQKPMTIDLASADRILKAVKESDRLFKVTDNYLFYPPIVLARNMINQGEIGTPSNIRIKMISGGSGGWTVPASAWAWRTAENLAGRGFATFDHGHHLWAVAWYLMGRFERVTSWIDTLDGIIDSPAVIMWKYKDGVKYGSCDYAYAPDLHVPSKYYANDEWFEITGSKGIIRIHRCTGEIVTGPGLTLFDGQSWKAFDGLKTDWQEGFIGSTHNFIAAIRGESDPLLTGEQAREILKTDLAISKSSRVRREVYVDELDAADPGAFTRKKIEAEINAKKESRDAQQVNFTANSNSGAIEQEVITLTQSLADRLDSSKLKGWTATILLELALGKDQPPLCCVFQFDNEAFNFSRNPLDLKPDLTIKVPAHAWINILKGAGSIEDAFSSGSLLLEGNIDDALKFKEALGI